MNKLLLYKTWVQSGRDLNLVGKLIIREDLLQQLENLTILQGQDPLISQRCQRDSSKFKIMAEQGVIYYRDSSNDRWKLFISKSIEYVILKSSHEQLGYAGSLKLFEYLRRYFFGAVCNDPRKNSLDRATFDIAASISTKKWKVAMNFHKLTSLISSSL